MDLTRAAEARAAELRGLAQHANDRRDRSSRPKRRHGDRSIYMPDIERRIQEGISQRAKRAEAEP